MESVYEVMIPKRIPILRNLGWVIIIWVLAILFLFWVLMSPSNGSAIEMKTAYFILAIPEWVKDLLIVAAVALPIGLLILRFTLYYMPGKLVVGESYLEIVAKKSTYKVLFSKITELQMGAGRHVYFFSNISTLIVILAEDDKRYNLLLRHYMQTEDLYQLLAAKGIRIGTYQDY